MSIRARLTFWFTAIFGVMVISLAIAGYDAVRRQAYSKLEAALAVANGATAMSSEHELNEHPTKSGGERDLQSVLDETGSPDLIDTQVLVREGSRNVAYKPGSRGTDLRTLPFKQLTSGASVSGLRISIRNLYVPKFGITYQIYSAKPIAAAAAQIRQILGVLLLVVPLGLLLAGAGGYVLAARALKPLQEFTQIVDTVSSSDLTARVKDSNHGDEISKLGSRFNALLDRIERSFILQRRFIADASHQIRTPLTVALAAAQVTGRDGTATTIDLRESLHTIEQQMLQLRRIVEDMFFLSQADSAELKIHRQEIYLDEVIYDASRAATALSREKHQTLSLDNLSEAKCLGDADLLKQAILILLDNAVKFTPAGGSISVALFRRESNWVCSVTDSGVGIPQEDRVSIFERFFQGGKPIQETRKGAGLGLSIAKSIVESHTGSLKLVESRPGKTVFEMEVPGSPEKWNADADQANCSAVRM